MRGLLIDVDFSTGRRAGGINPRDRGLQGHADWQDVEGGVEVRLVLDDRDLNGYEQTEGVMVLHDEAEVQAAIDRLAEGREEPPEVVNEALMVEHLRQKGVELDELAGLDRRELMWRLHDLGLAGVQPGSRRGDPPVRKVRRADEGV